MSNVTSEGVAVVVEGGLDQLGSPDSAAQTKEINSHICDNEGRSFGKTVSQMQEFIKKCGQRQSAAWRKSLPATGAPRRIWRRVRLIRWNPVIRFRTTPNLLFSLK